MKERPKFWKVDRTYDPKRQYSRKNHYSSETIILDDLETHMYDVLMDLDADVIIATLTNSNITEKEFILFHKIRKWFRENNPKAYMLLID